MSKPKDDWLLVPIDKQPKGLQYLELFDWRMEQMRGRCHLMTAHQWAFRFGCTHAVCRNISYRLEEKCQPKTLECDFLYMDQLDGITASDKKMMQWARKPWGSNKAHEESRAYLEELLYEDSTHRDVFRATWTDKANG